MSGSVGLKMKFIHQLQSVNTGTVIFLHGSGDTGIGVRAWIQSLLGRNWAFPHLKLVFPTAPLKRYSLLGGQLSNVWFDRLEISPSSPEQIESIDIMGKEICKLIDEEVSSGIPHNRIILGGFSMGGAMSLHTSIRWKPEIAGTFALSSLINENSAIYKHLEQMSGKVNTPPLFLCHGDNDELIPLDWAQESYNHLSKLGVNAEFHVLKGAMHELTKDELDKWVSWVLRQVPDAS